MASHSDGFAAPCVPRDGMVVLLHGAVLLANNAHRRAQAFADVRGVLWSSGMQRHPLVDPARLVASRAWNGWLGAQDGAALGISTSEAQMTPKFRMTELRNWLDVL